MYWSFHIKVREIFEKKVISKVIFLFRGRSSNQITVHIYILSLSIELNSRELMKIVIHDKVK